MNGAIMRVNQTKSMNSTVRKILSGTLSGWLALSGIPGSASPVFWGVSQAEAASDTIIRISQSGPGVKKSLKLGLNKAIVVDLPADAHDILVADPQMADAVTRTSRRIYLFGKAVGQTNIFVFGPGGEEIVSLDLVVERDISGLEANLRRFLPESDIKVEIISDNIVLTGTVRTPQDAAQASSLAEVFLKGGEATTRNSTATGGSENSGVAIFAEDRQTSQIVNLLKIDGEDQVTLKVTVAEVSRQVLKQLGFSGSIGGSSGSISFRNPSNLGGAVDAFGSAAISAASGDFTLASYMNAMEQAGVMRTLAEPSLTAISGEQAKFYVGGEFNIVAGQEVDENGVVTRTNEKTEYGIRLNFLPVVLSPGRISLKIETEVSEPTFQGNTVSSTVIVPDQSQAIPGATSLSIRKREASTTVELPSGGSIVIAGLVQDDIKQAFSGNPALSKIPIFGTLFRSKDFQRNETELVIIATPYLVRPVTASALARPDDNFEPVDDASTFFLNRVNKVYGRKESVTGTPYHGAVGFIYK
jgi:pilus assembly protein CpaC